MNPRQPNRSSAEWMKLITRCRQSGLSDSMWCEQQGIPVSAFYNAVTRLRKMACVIPPLCHNSCGMYIMEIANVNNYEQAKLFFDEYRKFINNPG